MKLLNILFVLLLAPAVWGESVSLTWTRPATRENGDTLTLAEIAGYTIKVRLDDEVEAYTFMDIPATDVSAGPYESLGTDARLLFGLNCFAIQAVDTNDLESQWSDEVCVTINDIGEYDLIIRVDVIDE